MERWREVACLLVLLVSSRLGGLQIEGERDIKLVLMSFVERLSSFIDSLKRYSLEEVILEPQVVFLVEKYTVSLISEGPLSKVQLSLFL